MGLLSKAAVALSVLVAGLQCSRLAKTVQGSWKAVTRVVKAALELVPLLQHWRPTTMGSWRAETQVLKAAAVLQLLPCLQRSRLATLAPWDWRVVVLQGNRDLEWRCSLVQAREALVPAEAPVQLGTRGSRWFRHRWNSTPSKTVYPVGSRAREGLRWERTRLGGSGCRRI